MRFGFLLKPGKPEAVRVAIELANLLAARGCPVVVSQEDGPELPGATRVARDRLGESVDALVVLGGDGTFLRGASLVADRGVPLLGINLGSLGFMTHYTLVEAPAAIEAAAAGRLPIDERMRLQVTVSSGGRVAAERSALNEAVIQRSVARLTELDAA